MIEYRKELVVFDESDKIRISHEENYQILKEKINIMLHKSIAKKYQDTYDSWIFVMNEIAMT